MRCCAVLCLLVCLVAAPLEAANLTVLRMLSDIKAQQGLEYVLLMSNANASSYFSQLESQAALAASIMQQLELPVLQLSERQSFYLHKQHSKRLLTVLYLEGEQLEQQTGLFKALAGNLRLMNLTPVLLLLQQQQAEEQYLQRLFLLCWQLKLIYVVALFADHQLSSSYYGYTPFPSFQLEQHVYEPGQLIYAERLRNLHGYRLPIIVGGLAPRLIISYNKQGQLQYKGSVGNFVSALEHKHNCSCVEPLRSKSSLAAPSTELVAAVRNGSVEISMGPTYPTIPMLGFSYPFEQLNWCIMLPIEPDVPAAEYYYNVFELNAFLLTLAAMLLISLVLNTALWRHGYRVNWLDFVLHDSCLRGTLGQSFVEVFRAPMLVRVIYLQICVLGILLTAWYNSYFASYFTSLPKQPAMHSYDDLLASKMKVVAWKNEYDELIGRLAEFRKYKSMFQVETNFNHYVQLRDSFNQKYGYMMHSTKWDTVNEQQKVFTRVLFRLRNDFCFFNNVPLCFPLHESSIYVELMHMLILEVAAYGFISHWRRIGFTELIAAGQLKLKDLSPGREYRAMHVEDLQYIWYGYGFMVVLTLLLLLCELAWHRRAANRKI